MKGRIIGLLLWFVCAPLAAVAQNNNQFQNNQVNAQFNAQAREFGREWLVNNGGVGLSIGIYEKGQRHFFNFGTTELEGGRAPTQKTVYEIGSISKTLAGQLLARAVVEARVNLQDPVAKYLEGPYLNLENDGEPVRLIHLANMTSQLADNIPDLTQLRKKPEEPLATTKIRVLEAYTRAEFLRNLRVVRPRFRPGSDPAHSNVASMLLGVVLEKVYGMPYRTLLEREIEKPLKMGSGAEPPEAQLAVGYTSEGEALPSFNGEMQFASGSLRYSTEDLLRYASWQVVERDASVKLAHQPNWSTLDKKVSLGFYWILSETPLGRRLRYSGGTYGFTAYCELYPDAQIAVVMLANKASDRAQENLRTLSERLVDSLRQQREAGVVSPPPLSSEPPRQPDR